MSTTPGFKAVLLIGSIFGASFLGTFLVTGTNAYLASRKTPVPFVPEEDATSSDSLPEQTESGAGSSHHTPVPPARFVYSFNAPGVLQEASRAALSTSPFWFLDSGGKLLISDGAGSTIQGALGQTDTWERIYARTNALDTDGGAHPQNIFRLTTKQAWKDSRVELSFFITATNLSDSPNRNASNGLLLMSRYQDHNTLYYAGIRVDGTAVLKKKYFGTYYTLAQEPLFSGTYDHDYAPNLLPEHTWLTLRMDTLTTSRGSVLVTLFFKEDSQTGWRKLLSVEDDGDWGDTPPITVAGVSGVRTDFMDVLFKNFQVTPL